MMLVVMGISLSKKNQRAVLSNCIQKPWVLQGRDEGVEGHPGFDCNKFCCPKF